MNRFRIACLAALALLPLAGCGRSGPPRPPGPKEQLIYPRAYPKPDPMPGARGTTPAPGASAPAGVTFGAPVGSPSDSMGTAPGRR